MAALKYGTLLLASGSWKSPLHMKDLCRPWDSAGRVCTSARKNLSQRTSAQRKRPGRCSFLGVPTALCSCGVLVLRATLQQQHLVELVAPWATGLHHLWGDASHPGTSCW